MLITPTLRGTTAVLALAGRLDQDNADAFRAELGTHLDAASREPHHIILDLSGLEYVSSAGLRCFMLAARQAKGPASKVVVASLQPMVAEIFQISRFDLVLKVYPGVEEALKDLGQSA